MDKGQLTAEQLGQQLKSHIAAKPGEVFLAQVAQKAGYKTAQFGKLDWGFQTTHQRLKRHGWDHYLGYLDHQRAHGFYPTYLWLNGQKLPLEGNTNINAARTKESYGKGTTARRRVHLRLKKPRIHRPRPLNFSQQTFSVHSYRVGADTTHVC